VTRNDHLVEVNEDRCDDQFGTATQGHSREIAWMRIGGNAIRTLIEMRRRINQPLSAVRQQPFKCRQNNKKSD